MMLNAVSKIVKMSTYVRNIVKYSTSSRIIQEKSDLFGEISRDDRYASITSSDIAKFRDIISDDNCLLTHENDPIELKKYNMDWLQVSIGESKLVLKPKTTEHVSQILKYCNDRKLAIVPQGGNTSLVCGGTPLFDEIVLSMERMNSIITIDDTSGIIICEAGCILQNLEEELLKHDLIVPLDLGSRGSCQIGGNVSTNAGGLRLLRYGSLHGNVLGLQVVLADGTVIDTLSPLRKDNTGYDLKQLFIGSEGNLGVVTAVSLLCPQLPRATNVTFMSCNSFEDVVAILQLAKVILSETLSAFEMLDSDSIKCVQDNMGKTIPVKENNMYCLVEVSGSNQEHNDEKLSEFLEVVMEKGLITDGTIAQDLSKARAIWSIREIIFDAFLVDGYALSYDLSLSLDDYYRIVPMIKAEFSADIASGLMKRVTGFGHVGDGNIHINVTLKQYDLEVIVRLREYLYSYVQQCRGSISAEHGLGMIKNICLPYSKSKEAIELMRRLKSVMDPNAILNPYKTLPPQV